LSGSSGCDTEELLDRVRGGDQSAVEELFARHRLRLRRMVAARMDERVARRADPSDVVQEALSVAYQRLPEYLNHARIAFYPWVRQIAWDRLVDLHRQHIYAGKRTVCQERSMQLSGTSAIQLAERLVSSQTGPSQHMVREELRARVRAILAKLADGDHEILIMKHLEELSNSECAAILEVSVAAVKKRHLRALGRVRKLMEDEF